MRDNINIMKEYTLSRTANDIMQERSISTINLERALFQPDSVEVSSKNPNLFLYKKVYFHEEEEQKRMLLVFIIKNDDELFVQFIVDSKIIKEYSSELK